VYVSGQKLEGGGGGVCITVCMNESVHTVTKISIFFRCHRNFALLSLE
jgi:hypothetical protein